MRKHVIVGDLHGRSEEPFYSSFKLFLKWLKPQIDEDTLLILLGDVLHNAKSDGITNQLLVKFFQQLPACRIIVLQGNHDYSKIDGLGLLPVLELEKNIEIIAYPKTEIIDGVNYLFLPHYYPFSNDLPPMEDFYSNIDNSFSNKFDTAFDYILTHVGDERQTFFKKHCDLSFLTGKRVSGHVHHYQEGYIGSSLITRANERGKDSYIAIIDPSTKAIDYVVTPVFMDYCTVKFSEEVPSTKAAINFLDITDAPSQEEAEKLYKGYHIHSIDVVSSSLEAQESKEEVGESKTVVEYFNSFVKDFGVEEEVRDIVFSAIGSR